MTHQTSCSSQPCYVIGSLQIPPRDGHPGLDSYFRSPRRTADLHRLELHHAWRTIKELESKTQMELELIRRDIKQLETGLRTDIKALEEEGKKEREAIRCEMAHNHDLVMLQMKNLEENTKKDIKSLEESTKKDIKALEESTKKEIKELEISLKRDMKEYDVKNQKERELMGKDLKIWFGGMLGTAVVLLGAFITVMGHIYSS